MNLSERLRPDVEAAPWVIDGVRTLEQENARLREALAWYGEQARLARLIHSEGDAGRHALAEDGGKRALDAARAAGGHNDA